ncbi:DUF3540 domain-containing protein [Amorphus orientalis]|uniref:DUF3540 domain-containing protein n=1 Tax=Amorphus orientalis TaxID=649198 RepID=A0AAE4AQN2_9HYPH|nr:DUF3540 domain-containing protein [Amorphus orientalis]MDQ0314276.1 hypothetical protein [Amorphus orientalis]
MQVKSGTTLIAEVTEATIGEPAARSQSEFATGQVGEVADRRFRLETEHGPVLARRAVSCLVEPQTGDRVLYVVEEEGRGTILHILSRPDPERQAVTLSNPDGPLRLRGSEVSVETEGSYAVSAGGISLTAPKAELTAKTLTMVGEGLQQVYGRIQTNTRSLETMSERIVTKALDRVEIVDNTDNQMIGTLSVKVSGVMTQASYSTVLVATEDLRMDGKRVTVG